MQRIVVAKAVSAVGIPFATVIAAAEPALKDLPTWTEHYEIIQWAFAALCAIVAYAFVYYINSQIKFNENMTEEMSKTNEKVEGLSHVVYEIKGAHDANH